MARAVVLTGRGVVSPLGVGIEEHWEALLSGRSAIAPVARLRALGLSISRGAEIAPSRLETHLGRLPRKQQKLYNRATLLGMLAASLAAEEARLTASAVDPDRLGVILGVNALAWSLASMTEYLVAAESREEAGRLDMALANAFCMRRINPLEYSLKTLPNLAAGHLAIAHNARGLCRALTEGPLGGAQAIGQAYRLIADGDLDVALCGGADALLEELVFATSTGLGLLAADDGGSPGAMDGEGAGILVLEAAEHAESRGAQVFGEIRGFAAAAGAAAFAPRDDAVPLAARLERVIREACDEDGGEVGLVSLHADGVPAHDRAEALALGPRRDTAPAVRLKSAFGNLGAASTPVEVLSCSAMMHHAMIPRVVSNGSSSSGSGFHRALVLALGLFGECAALVLERPRGARAN